MIPYDVVQILITIFARRMASVKDLSKRIDVLEKRVESLEKESGGGD